MEYECARCGAFSSCLSTGILRPLLKCDGECALISPERVKNRARGNNAMTFKCPFCRIEIDADDADAGEVGNCPNCGKSIRIPNKGNKVQYYYKKRSRAASARSSEPEPENNDTLCFWMGFLFSFFGVLIAAIVGKGRGVCRAFWGMLVSMFVVGIIVLLIWLHIKAQVREAQEKRNEALARIEKQQQEEMAEFEREMNERRKDHAAREKITDTEMALYDVTRGVDLWIEKYKKAPDSYQQVVKSYHYEFNELTERQDAKWFIEPNKQKDAWGNEYMLVIKSVDRDDYMLKVEYALRSAGPDGVFKTEDDLLKKGFKTVFLKF